MLYRTVIALVAAGSVNSTGGPGGSVTAFRPEASAGSVYAVRSGPITVPSVRAFSASCSRNGTVAPRPATSDGARAARVTTGGGVPAAAAGDRGDRRAATPPRARAIARPAAARTGRPGGRCATPMLLRAIE